MSTSFFKLTQNYSDATSIFSLGFSKVLFYILFVNLNLMLISWVLLFSGDVLRSWWEEQLAWQQVILHSTSVIDMFFHIF